MVSFVFRPLLSLLFWSAQLLLGVTIRVILNSQQTPLAWHMGPAPACGALRWSGPGFNSLARSLKALSKFTEVHCLSWSLQCTAHTLHIGAALASSSIKLLMYTNYNKTAKLLRWTLTTTLKKFIIVKGQLNIFFRK